MLRRHQQQLKQHRDKQLVFVESLFELKQHCHIEQFIEPSIVEQFLCQRRSGPDGDGRLPHGVQQVRGSRRHLLGQQGHRLGGIRS